MTDESIMPLGKYKGEQMIYVPASYLVWLYEGNWLRPGELKSYIEGNLNVLKTEIKEQQK